MITNNEPYNYKVYRDSNNNICIRSNSIYNIVVDQQYDKNCNQLITEFVSDMPPAEIIENTFRIFKKVFKLYLN